MPPTYFPLRWESTGDQWWYATPIDFAAANSHYDLVLELLRLDSNNLMTLTSLRRLRRLETVWDDDSHFHDVASCRSRVARKLLSSCDLDIAGSKTNTLIQSGYGGWLMYTAASAGDLGFVRHLLDRNPLLVFGEGEYGVTDIFYAAARSKNDQVFHLIYDYAVSPRFGYAGFEQQTGDIPAAYKWEMKNRAVHSASRGGNLILLRQLLSDCSVEDVLAFRDKQGSTILHAAAGKGKTQVVKELVASYALVDAIDNQGNTALHVAAYRGHADLVEALISASPSLISARNNAGDTFLHAGISGFQTPAFERLDKHTELMNRLITSAASTSPGDFVNYRNKEGRTALHLAISGNVPLEFVEMLMSVKSIDINIRDHAGMTPLDLIRQKPQSPTSDLLFRRLVSAGGMFSSCDQKSITSVVASHLKDRGNFYSPGARFRTSDAEIFLSRGLEASSVVDPRHVRSSSCSIEVGQPNVAAENNHLKKCRNSSVNSSATDRLKSVFHWPRIKKQPGRSKNDSGISITSTALETQETPVPLRQRFSKSSPSSLSMPNNNKRTLSVRSNQSSPRARKKRVGWVRSRSSSFSKISIHSSSTSSCSSMVDVKQKGVLLIDTSIAGPSGLKHPEPVKTKLTEKKGSVRRRLKSPYFCFGASALSVKTPAATILV